MEVAKMDERKRESMIAYLRRRMAKVGMKAADLAAALKEEQLRQKSVRYRNAFGDTWDGKGGMPQWLQQATSAGQSLQHFAVIGSEKPAATAQRRTGVDWSKDPFAGTRLATAPRG
ncbi:H-NS family nucleoid-associated regulatory protein [Paraburkholderia sp. SARCC-3016]|nr:H-NS family nucleoid-associated regulatory protein [Paraburkholderia sp. SARCC-3016]MDQ7981588.1 H-NS family nucleoid-associated regulatory protein [Paraburkholderia sp. SARCC-3016]